MFSFTNQITITHVFSVLSFCFFVFYSFHFFDFNYTYTFTLFLYNKWLNVLATNVSVLLART